ncbi:MAG TPA: hypothetical protein VFO16_03690 [Pseudonocardiaceae bacterium]|nr:hypothetical protein [Pseudonocardiaceae bacterium]
MPVLLVHRSTPAAAHLSEADHPGITMTVAGKDLSATVAVRGRSGPVASAERAVAVRQREEIPFAAAISQGRVVAGPAATTGQCVTYVVDRGPDRCSAART